MKLNRFQKNFMKNVGFLECESGFKTRFSDPDNPNKGFVTYYVKKNAYTVVCAQYDIPQDFELIFDLDINHLRFGTVVEGVAEYQIEDQPVTNFKPASFIAIERNITGIQRWKENQHYRGVEVFVEMPYLEQLSTVFPSIKQLLELPENNALLFLPLEVIDILRTILSNIESDKLTPLMLESRIFESLAIIEAELSSIDQETLEAWFIINAAKKSTCVGVVNASDLKIIRAVRDQLKDNMANPPTIQAICKELYMNEQKLTVGFKKVYGMTIGHYIKEIRLTEAGNLLTTTDLSVDEIATRVGYSHSSNFSKAFKRKYKRTPLQYRKYL